LKLAVIGEPCMDYIHRGSDSTEKQFGGILYSVVSLAVIAGKRAEIYPVMNLGEDEYENVTSLLGKIGNINMEYINKSDHKTRVVSLYYKDKDSVLNVSTKKTYDREENSTEPTPPVKYEHVQNILGELDGILVNMVSGVDIELGDLQRVRENFTGYMHMDVHNLVMQTFPDGTRKQMPLKNWQEWCSISDTLQMNESEMTILTGDNVTEYETAEKILSNLRVWSVVVTRGLAGVSMYEMKQKSFNDENHFELDKTDIVKIESEKFVDSTGCGDVFASGFFYKNVGNNLKDLGMSLRFANRMAGKNAGLHGVEDLIKLND
jgi:hypothetical protein